ncbi:MAG: IS4 family transposase [Planctomycetota bacterium]
MNQSLTSSAGASIWASRIASVTDLGDERLEARFAQILQTLSEKPLDSFPQACESSGEAKALYRFLKNKRTRHERLLAPIVDVTAEQCRGQKVVLAVQDTTSVNFSNLEFAVGLGPLNDKKSVQGLLVHSTLALSLDGTPLGLLDQQSWARPKGKKTRDKRRKRALKDKESSKWLAGAVAARGALGAIEETSRPRLFHVMDREGDIHLVMQSISATPDGAVIRCAQNRRIAGEINKAHEAVRVAPLLGRATIDVPRRSNEKARKANLEIRALRATITPSKSHGRDRAPITWTLVELYEIDPPAGIERLHWRLWTTESVATLDQAMEIARKYTLRWRIEDFHLTLKSGCRIEALTLRNAERLQKAITLYSAVAVRIVALREVSRKRPDAPCTEMLSDDEWRALWCKIHKKPAPLHQPPPTMQQAVLWIGRLGGHLNRKGDGMPGVRTLWRGMRDLAILVAGYRCGLASR